MEIKIKLKKWELVVNRLVSQAAGLGIVRNLTKSSFVCLLVRKEKEGMKNYWLKVSLRF